MADHCLIDCFRAYPVLVDRISLACHKVSWPNILVHAQDILPIEQFCRVVLGNCVLKVDIYPAYGISQIGILFVGMIRNLNSLEVAKKGLASNSFLHAPGVF